MRNHRKLLAILLVAGVLLGGFGAGVALVEYSSLEYMGMQTIGQTDMTTEEFTLALPAGSKPTDPLSVFSSEWSRGNQVGVQGDNTVPKGTLLVRITYNQAQIRPELLLREEDNILQINWIYTVPSSDLARMFTVKDQILQELKEHKISEYDTVTVESIVLLLNPQDRGRVVF